MISEKEIKKQSTENEFTGNEWTQSWWQKCDSEPDLCCGCCHNSVIRSLVWNWWLWINVAFSSFGGIVFFLLWELIFCNSSFFIADGCMKVCMSADFFFCVCVYVCGIFQCFSRIMKMIIGDLWKIIMRLCNDLHA